MVKYLEHVEIIHTVGEMYPIGVGSENKGVAFGQFLYVACNLVVEVKNTVPEFYEFVVLDIDMELIADSLMEFVGC